MAALLAGVVLVTRLPFRAQHLTTWDSVLFALALDRYDVLEARPHAPGYPVYVAMGRAVHVLVPDHNAALVWLSVLLTMASVAMLYLFVRRLWSRRAALIGSVLFLVAPVTLYNSVIATSYAGEALFGIALAWAAWESRRSGGAWRAALVAGLLALAVGFRQSLLVYLGPLAVWGLAARPWDPSGLVRRLAAACAAGVAVGLAWLVPMVAATGWGAYRTANEVQFQNVVWVDSVFVRGPQAIVDHLWRLGVYLSFEWMVLLPVVAVAVSAGWFVARWRGEPRFLRRVVAGPPGAWALLGVWLFPALLFFVFIFNGWDRAPTGYVLVLLPALYGALGVMVDGAVREMAVPHAARRATRVAPVVLAAVLLVAAPVAAVQWDDHWAREVQGRDQWTDQWLALSQEFPAGSTAILASFSWAHVKWHYPEYLLWGHLDLGFGAAPGWVPTFETYQREDSEPFYMGHLPRSEPAIHAIPDRVERIVIFDFQLAGENGGPRALAADVEVKEAWLNNGWRVLFFEPHHATLEEHLQGGHA